MSLIAYRNVDYSSQDRSAYLSQWTVLKDGDVLRITKKGPGDVEVQVKSFADQSAVDLENKSLPFNATISGVDSKSPMV